MNVIEDDIKAAVDKELRAAIERFGLHHSNHEKMAVIAEEYEETSEALEGLTGAVRLAWHYVRENADSYIMADLYGRIYDAAVKLAIEACQTAAMADKAIERAEDENDGE